MAPFGASRAGLMSVAKDEIPDSGVPNELYRWNGVEIGVSDGTSPFNWPESIAGLDDADAIGEPTFRSDQGGVPASEYDGTDDAHGATPNGNAPEGSEDISVFVTAWFNSIDDHAVFDESGNDSEGFHLGIRDDGDVIVVAEGGANPTAGVSVDTGEWVTLGVSFNASNNDGEAFYNGSGGGRESGTDIDLSGSLYEFARRRGSEWYHDGYLFDVTVADADEPESVHSDYHNNMMDHING